MSEEKEDGKSARRGFPLLAWAVTPLWSARSRNYFHIFPWGKSHGLRTAAALRGVCCSALHGTVCFPQADFCPPQQSAEGVIVEVLGPQAMANLVMLQSCT